MTDIIYIDAPPRPTRKIYGTAARILDQLETHGPWLTSRFLARELDVEIPLVNRTLHRLYHRGLVAKRTIDEQRDICGYDVAGSVNQWSLP